MSEDGVRFKAGDWNAICDVCAQKYKASEMRKRWDGLMVCPNDYESRHPQDFLRAVPDRMAVPWSRPRTPDVFVPFNYGGYATDLVTMQDVLTYNANFIRYIPSMDVVQKLPPNQRPLNSFSLNTYVLNDVDPAQPLTQETVHNSETLILNFTKKLADSTTMSESLMAVLGTALFDSTTTSEYLSVTFLFKQAPLDGNALNAGPL